jgi:hypothetical protein
MLSGTKTFTISTRANKDGDAQNTALTIDLNGCSEDVAVALAIQSAVIKWQGHARKHGIPERATIKLADLAPGRRMQAVAVPMTGAEMVKKMKTDLAYRAEVEAALLEAATTE